MKRLVILASLALAGTQVHAAGEFSHLDITYVMPDFELSGVDIDGDGNPDSLSGDGDGIGIEFATGFLGSSFLVIEHTARNIDSFEFNGSSAGSGGGDLDVKTTEFGLGYSMTLGESGALQPYGSISLYEFEVEGSSDDGFTLVLGAEFALNERLSLGGRYKQFNSSEDNSDGELSGFRLSATYALGPNLGLVLRYESLSADDDGANLDLDDIHFGVRVLFGSGDE